MADSSVVELEIVIGEDFACQIFWVSEYNEPIPIADPVLGDVKDANGQIALRFATTGDADTGAFISVGGPNGFFQLTCPASLTRQLVPGRYAFDLFACVADSSAPFDRQMQQVLSGWVVALPRVTLVEGAGEAVLSSTPSG